MVVMEGVEGCVCVGGQGEWVGLRGKIECQIGRSGEGEQSGCCAGEGELHRGGCSEQSGSWETGEDGVELGFDDEVSLVEVGGEVFALSAHR